MKQKKVFEITIKNIRNAKSMPIAFKINALSISIFTLFMCIIFGLGILAATMYADSRKDIMLLGSSLDQQSSILEAEGLKISSLNSSLSSLESDLASAASEISEYQNQLEGLETQNDHLSQRVSASYQNSLEQQVNGLKSKINKVSDITFASGSINSGVVLLSWFDGGDEVFKKYESVTVVDVETGLRFQVERFGGWYHADCQPLTKDDTAIMKSIVGEWTWDRRPIWVNIGGTYYAASMNTMPHLVSPSSANDFPGHFCIHFYHSRIHATDSECPSIKLVLLKHFSVLTN